MTLLGGGNPGGGAPGGKISTSDKEANDEFLTFNGFSLERKTCFTHFLLQGTAVCVAPPDLPVSLFSF